MNLKNVKIGTQLKLGLAIKLLFVLVLGTIAFEESADIQQQTEILYNEPFQLACAVGALRFDIANIRSDTRALFLPGNDGGTARILNRIGASKADALEQIGILARHSLVSRTMMDSVRQSIILWFSMGEETIRLLRAGGTARAAAQIADTGSSAAQAAGVLAGLRWIDEDAKTNGAAIHARSRSLNDSLNRQLILLIAFILSLSILINTVVLRNIRAPIREMTNASGRFHGGDMNARSSYTSKNEFGVLSASFNTLVETIQTNTDLSDKTATIAGIMLGSSEARSFFRTTLAELCAQTGSQVSAVYLLSDDKQTFEHFESIGAVDAARRSFAADGLEGEFGAALSSRKIQRIADIPADTRSVFQTVSGTFLPRAIITIPIYADNEAIAVISLASVVAYSEQSIRLIDNLHVTLTARVEGILAYRKSAKYMGALEQLNNELESQKEEMASQSYKLQEINTELEMQKRQLNEAGRLKSNFLSNMSHELRTPLNSVIALSGVLHRRLSARIPEEESGYLEVIERNGKHLLSLINDILDISRIEAGFHDMEITSFSANAVIADIVRMVQPLAMENSTELLHADSDTPVMISSDRGKCRHILQNIIGNAAKFTEHGTVDIAVRQLDGYVEITVSDTGIGIAEDHLPHIFDQFRQADGSTSRKYGGTGLGLAIAVKYAHLLGGTISVKSTLGTGSEFTITLPQRYPESMIIAGRSLPIAHATEFPRGSRTLAPGASGKTILLVEDSEPALIQIRNFLEETGYQILVVRDGRDALESIARSVPDALALDLMIPGPDGYAVLKTLRDAELTAHIPVLVLTAQDITKEALLSLKRKNIHQLIQKGEVNGSALRNAVTAMVFPESAEKAAVRKVVQNLEGKPVLLLVEDNPDNMLTLRALLGEMYELLEAGDGNTGVAMAAHYVPHLILMDIALPGMDGITAFAAIRKDPRLQHIPVIAITASAMASDRTRLLELGFDGYIAKPVDETKLFTMISDALYG
ncbi:MAG: response regulator [Ignavibacteria bacterium]|nr:response regulator [Ignavibacteria bacterium]